MTFLFANNARTTLAQSLTATGTSVSLASGGGDQFPSPGTGEMFALFITSASSSSQVEVCYCTARSSDTLTVKRGMDNTTAQTFSAGDYVTLGPVAGVTSLLAQAGNLGSYSAATATAIGGYALNAIMADASTVGLFWVSTVGSNATTPGATGASWQKFGWDQFVKQGLSGGTLSTGNQVYIGLRTGVTSGAARIGAVVDDTDFGNFAMVGKQTLGLGNWTEQYYTLPSGGSKTISLTFDAPLDGYVLVVGSANYSVQNTNQTNLTIIVNGTSLSADQVTGSTSMTNHSCVKVSAGSVTVSSYCGTSATNPPNVGHTLSYLYIPA